MAPENKSSSAWNGSAAMPVGFILAGAMNNLLSDWHTAFLTGIVPLMIAAVAVFTLPESQGWKNTKRTLLMALLSAINFCT
jgi:hypothetical protein